MDGRPDSPAAMMPTRSSEVCHDQRHDDHLLLFHLQLRALHVRRAGGGAREHALLLRRRMQLRDLPVLDAVRLRRMT